MAEGEVVQGTRLRYKITVIIPATIIPVIITTVIISSGMIPLVRAEIVSGITMEIIVPVQEEAVM